MLPTVYSLLLLSQNFFDAQAAPAAVDPTSISLNTVTASNLSTTPSSLFTEETLNSLALALDPANPEPIVFFRVPDTHTVLRIGVQDEAIPKSNLGRTILRTQESLAAFIGIHDAGDRPLSALDDPYESAARYAGCFFGVATFPIGYQHLTYGIVMNVLQGLWLYLYRANRFQTAVFEVRDDQLGTVGIGKITPGPPAARMGLGIGMGSGKGNESVA